MTLDLLDLLFIVSFCFDRPVPWWLWLLGIAVSYSSADRIEKLIKALK